MEAIRERAETWQSSQGPAQTQEPYTSSTKGRSSIPSTFIEQRPVRNLLTPCVFQEHIERTRLAIETLDSACA